MRGFTLLELLVVLLLLSLSLALVGPRLAFWGRPHTPFVVRVEDLVTEARTKAQEQGRPLLLVFDPEGRRLLLLEVTHGGREQSVEVPEDFEVKASGLLEVEGRPGLLFLADGTASGGEIELIDRVRGHRVLLRIPRALAFCERRELD